MRKQIIEQWKGAVRFTPIESPGTRRSIPDLQARSRTLDWWIELKQTELISGLIKIPWRAGQMKWLERHESLDGNAALIITIGAYYYIIKKVGKMMQYYKGLAILEKCSDYHGSIWNAPKDLWERK